jgi:hypothetical protein
MLVVREINGDQQYDIEIISRSDDLETARTDLVEWLAAVSASEKYADVVLADLDKLDVAFDSTFEHDTSAEWSDRYEWLCASSAAQYMAV